MKYMIVKIIIIIVVLLVILVFGINFYVKASTKKQIIDNESELSNLSDVDCILILGAGVRNNAPSPMLEDRLLKGIELYNKNISNKIIMSGDHGREEYDEVNIMKDFAIDKGIKSEDIFMDHAGFSTYESIYRAKERFVANRITLVTHSDHFYRALYIANSLGIEAYGVSADLRTYTNQLSREIREIVARDKDFIKCIYKPKPTYLGDTIPVSGNGDITND